MAELDRGAKIVLQTAHRDFLRLAFPNALPGDPIPTEAVTAQATLDHVRRATGLIERLPNPAAECADLVAALFLLSDYHFTSKERLAIMSEEALMQSKTYQSTLDKGREEGREEGRRTLLVDLLAKRLGAFETLDRIRTCDAEAIEALTRLLADAPAHDVLRAEVERLLGP